MARFFSKLRYAVINENTSKYLKYAIGEIILVVVGILIALQINNWNNKRLTHNKELAYLSEIRNNLQQDSLAMEDVIQFNTTKSKVVEDLLQIFNDSLTTEERYGIFAYNSGKFVDYRVFEPTNIAFNNMLSAESVDLISDSELKTLLSQYYSYDFKGGVQDRIIYYNFKVLEYAFPELMTNEYVKNIMKMENRMPPISEFNI